jgi:hypothetical protein
MKKKIFFFKLLLIKRFDKPDVNETTHHVANIFEQFMMKRLKTYTNNWKLIYYQL